MANKLRIVLREGEAYYWNANAKRHLESYLRDYRRHFPQQPVFGSTQEKLRWIFEHAERVIGGQRELWMFREPLGCSTRKSGWRQTLEAAGQLPPKPKRKKKPAPGVAVAGGVVGRAVRRARWYAPPQAMPPQPEPAPPRIVLNAVWNHPWGEADHYVLNEDREP